MPDNESLDIALIVGRPLKTSPKDTVKYELEMLTFAWSEINSATGVTATGSRAWMAMECFLLHYRNLVEFLATPDGKRAVGFNDGSARNIPEVEFQALWSRK